MLPNAVNMCIQCLSSRVDITEGISTQNTLHMCNQCNRYLGPPWQKCEPESQELLALCLKKIKGLNKVKVVNASFIWTEPHSKRIKVKVTIQKEIQANTSLETTLVIEFILKNLQCDDCKKTWTPHKWNTIVQLRQKVDHKRTILYVEQLILKHHMHKKAVNIKEMPDGIDFCFASKIHAMEFSTFIQSQIVSKHKESKQLISADKSSNHYNYVHTIYIELAPICKEDLVYIPPKLQKELGGASPLCLVLRVASLIQLFDPVILKVHTIDSACYWSYELFSVCSKHQLSEYVVLNMEPMISPAEKGHPEKPSEYSYADLELQRVADFGENETRFFARTHLGNILKIDDRVMAYDLSTITSGNIDYVKEYTPDVIVVKKSYQKKDKGRKREWRLKHLKKEESLGKKVHKRQVEKEEKDYEEFLEELEEDPEMKSKVKVFKTAEAKKKEREEQFHAKPEGTEGKHKPSKESSEPDSEPEVEQVEEEKKHHPIPPPAKPQPKGKPQSKRAKRRQEKRRAQKERLESHEEEEQKTAPPTESKTESEDPTPESDHAEAEFPKMKFTGLFSGLNNEASSEEEEGDKAQH